MRLIMIVEDNPAITACIDDVLREEGYLTHICSTGASGLAAIAQQAPSPVVLDYHLPDMTLRDVIGRRS